MADSSIVFLFDVDNTLLDNDQVTADLRRHLNESVGSEKSKRYWELFEQIRSELGYADYLGALQRYRIENLNDQQLLVVSYYLLSYPFANRLFPGSIDAVRAAQGFGASVILSDGDVVFQPRKVYRSGLYEVFQGKVLIYIHKEQQLKHVEHLYPASHYVMVDDKLRILDAMKAAWGDRLTTVFVRQGHYAMDEKSNAKYQKADITLERIGDFRSIEPARFRTAAVAQPIMQHER